MADEQTTPVVENSGSPSTPESGTPDISPAKAELSPLLEAVGRPIPGSDPCGVDVSYDEDYLRIKAEIDKMGTVSGRVDQERASELRQMMDATRDTLKKAERAEAEKQLEQRASVVEQSGGPDYGLIKDLSLKILSEKSKDIRVASYLCFALWHTQMFPGLAEGLSAIDILVRGFWEGLYPPKARLGARKNAVEFLTSKLGEVVEYTQVKVDDAEPLRRAKEVLASLQKGFTEKIPDSPPSILGMVQAVEKCLSKVPKPSPPSVPAAPGSTASSAPGQPLAGSAGPQPAVIGELRTNQDAVDLVKKAAKFFRDQNRKNPVPYRLVRSLKWDGVGATPPNESGKTKFEAPPLPRRNFLIGLRDASDWSKLLDECELSFGNPGFHFWLDLQRLAVAALDGLGSEFQVVRTAIVTELVVLLRRVPALTSLTFTDGTGFADPATCDWIEETVNAALGQAGATGPGPGARFLDSELDTEIADAKKTLDAGDLPGAILLLQSNAPKDNSRRSAFRRKLAMAALCMRGNQPSIARTLLEELCDEIDRFSIDEWEPAITLDVWTNLHKCYETLASGPASPAKQAVQQLEEKVFERICRLDVGYALATTGAKPKTKPQAPPQQAETKPDAKVPAKDDAKHDPSKQSETRKSTKSHPQS